MNNLRLSDLLGYGSSMPSFESLYKYGERGGLSGMPSLESMMKYGFGDGQFWRL